MLQEVHLIFGFTKLESSTQLLLRPLLLTLLGMLQSSYGWPEKNVLFRCPALREKSPGKFLWCTPSAEASGLSRQFLEFSGVRDGGIILPRDFSIFAAGMWERSHLLNPSRRLKCRDVGRDVVRCDRGLTVVTCQLTSRHAPIHLNGGTSTVLIAPLWLTHAPPPLLIRLPGWSMV